MADELRQHPIWKHAANIAAENFDYGDMITFDWLHQSFEIEKPEKGDFKTFQTYQFEMLSAIDGFRQTLLDNHQMATENIRGKGYRIVKPKEQTQYAEDKFNHDLKNNIRKAFNLLRNVAIDMLEENEKKRNADAIGRLAAVRAFSRNTTLKAKAIGHNKAVGE